MRVALNLEQLLHRPPGGIGRYSAELARLLPTSGEAGSERVEVLAFVARHHAVEVEAAMIGFGLEHVDPARLALPRVVLYDLWNDLGAGDLRHLSRRLRAFDVVHAPSLAVPPRSGAKLVVTVHDAAPILFPATYTRRGRWFHERGFAAAARRADLVIAPTSVAADEVAGCTPIPRDRIEVVPHGVVQREVGDGLVASTRSTLAVGESPYVLWVGTLEPRKNVGVLVEGFRRMVEREDLPHRLIIVGPRGWLGAAEALQEPARALGKRIHFTGPVRADRLLALFRGADLVALPSVHEGFGLPVIEAMSQATPVMCADIPVLHEVAGDAAVFVDPHDPDAWAKELTVLLRDESARRELGEAGRVRASGYTWERCAERTRELYRKVLDT